MYIYDDCQTPSMAFSRRAFAIIHVLKRLQIYAVPTQTVLYRALDASIRSISKKYLE